MRRIVWLTLQAAGALSLTACFAIIDFDLNDGEGAGGLGGTPGAGGTSSVSGTLSTGGSGGGGGGPVGGSPPCSGCGVEDCEDGVCQATVFYNAGAKVAVLAAGEPHLAFMVASDSSPMMFIDASSGVLVKTMQGAGTWDARGSLTVSPSGVAFYSPEDADSANPVRECDPSSASCVVSFGTSTAANLSGMSFFAPRVYGVTPSGLVWGAQPGDPSGVVAFEVQDEMDNPVSAAHALAFRGNRVMATSRGLQSSSPACVAIGTAQLLDLSDVGVATCLALPSQYVRIAAVSIAPDGTMFGRVLTGGEPMNALTLRFGDAGQIDSDYADMLFPIADLNDPIGAIASDPLHVYFFADMGGKRLVRCDLGAGSESCKPASPALVSLGPMAENEDAVFFSSGSVIYRLPKAVP